MKKYILSLLLLAPFLLSAQSETYSFKNGSKYTVDIKSADPDQCQKASIYFGAFGPETINLIGASYYQPKYFYLNAAYGLGSNGTIEGNYFLFSKKKSKTFYPPVDIKYGTGNSARPDTILEISVPGEVRKLFGLHGGVSHYDNYQYDGFSSIGACGLVFGVSYMNVKHTDVRGTIKFKKVRATRFLRVNADVIYYFDKKASKPGTEINIDNDTRNIGYRVYCDGRYGIWGRNGRLSLLYMFGVGLKVSKESVPVTAGVGLGFNFL